MDPKLRHQARKILLQAYYQWQLSGDKSGDLIKQYQDAKKHIKVDWPFFQEVLIGAINKHQELDAIISTHIERPLGEINPIEIAILRLGVYELESYPDTPFRVIIDQYLMICDIFGSEGGYRYVNGVLDKVAKSMGRF